MCDDFFECANIGHLILPQKFCSIIFLFNNAFLVKLRIPLYEIALLCNKTPSMLSDNLLNTFRRSLLNWYDNNKRDLPWRETQDAYKIWLSEIILQQTRVNQGLAYYNRFIQQFPNVQRLANAHEEEILKLWQGLGYYSRARNIHATAKTIVSEYNGIFPTEYEEIIRLKGIGDYTAAAICSFSQNKPYAVLDGNVFRVLARIFNIDTAIDTTCGKKEFKTLAQSLLDKNKAALYNQAIMEFGALQCVPNKPDCENCIFNYSCCAFAENKVQYLPVKSKKTKVRERFFNYLVILDGSYCFIQKRTENDVWKNLYEFPLIETAQKIDFSELVLTDSFRAIFKNTGNIELLHNGFYTKHILSHQKIHAVFYTLKTFSTNISINRYEKTFFNKLANYPVSRLIEIYLESQKII